MSKDIIIKLPTRVGKTYGDGVIEVSKSYKTEIRLTEDEMISTLSFDCHEKVELDESVDIGMPKEAFVVRRSFNEAYLPKQKCKDIVIEFREDSKTFNVMVADCGVADVDTLTEARAICSQIRDWAYDRG